MSAAPYPYRKCRKCGFWDGDEDCCICEEFCHECNTTAPYCTCGQYEVTDAQKNMERCPDTFSDADSGL